MIRMARNHTHAKDALKVITWQFKRLGWWHITLWIGYSLLFFYGPALFFDTKTAVLLTLRTLAINALIFYVNTLILLPLLIGRNHVKTYVLSLVFLLAGISFLWHITDPVGPETWEKIKERREMVHPESPPENGSEREILRLDRNPAPSPGPPRPDNNSPGPHLFFGFVQMLGILFLSTLFWMVLESRRKEKEQLSLTNQNLETEMKFLKSQMNPHFLFNALNNIYSLSQQGSAKTPKLLLKLSSMLRFIVYETDEKKIPIGREIDYILDFIEFQKIKLEEKPNLEIDFNQIDREIRIEPMLIFPFFENAFKHGNIGDTKNGWIKAFLKAKDGHIVFFIANSKPAGHVSKDKSKGIGIENVKKRLSFLYKDRYRLNIVDKLDFFEVQMEIET